MTDNSNQLSHKYSWKNLQKWTIYQWNEHWFISNAARDVFIDQLLLKLNENYLPSNIWLQIGQHFS